MRAILRAIGVAIGLASAFAAPTFGADQFMYVDGLSPAQTKGHAGWVQLINVQLMRKATPTPIIPEPAASPLSAPRAAKDCRDCWGRA